MSAHKVFWTSPSPFWEKIGVAGKLNEMSKPAILRFATDDFMNEYATILASDPRQLPSVTAKSETWERPCPPSNARLLSIENEGMSESARKLGFLKRMRAKEQAPENVSEKNAPLAAIKLFQPIHQRYYLVSACLLCKPAGLGDHILNTETREKVGFVVRRLINSDAADESKPVSFEAFDEYAYVHGQDGAGWRKLDDIKKIAPGEERLPLFPMYFNEANGFKRRLFTGLVPVGRKDEYAGAAAILDNEGESARAKTTKKTGRMRLFQIKVAGPWQRLVEQAAMVNGSIGPEEEPVIASLFDTSDQRKDEDKNTAKENHRTQVIEISRLILFDYADFLKRYCSDLWENCIAAKNRTPAPGAEDNLISALSSLTLAKEIIYDFAISGSAPSLLKTLQNISSETDESITYPLAYLDRNVFSLESSNLTTGEPVDEIDKIVPEDAIDSLYDSSPPGQFQALLDIIDTLTTLTIRAMPPDLPANEYDIPVPLAAQPPIDTRESYFALRCVFERPMCGEILQPPVVSDRTDVFAMSGFFDPEAPARPIRIGLPLDTSPAGLRKFAKNTAFMISDALCGQIQAIKKMTFGDLVLSVLPWPFHKDLSSKFGKITGCTAKGDPAGMMCSLSIPIVTLCALMLLIMIVAILDFIFKWMPFLIVCFPLPKFKAKGSS